VTQEIASSRFDRSVLGFITERFSDISCGESLVGLLIPTGGLLRSSLINEVSGKCTFFTEREQLISSLEEGLNF